MEAASPRIEGRRSPGVSVRVSIRLRIAAITVSVRVLRVILSPICMANCISTV